MRRVRLVVPVLALLVLPPSRLPLFAADPPVSEATAECIGCHESVTPGIVEDWRRSRHSVVTPADGLKAERLSRRVSATEIPGDLARVVVGCAECHTADSAKHADTFEHNGHRVHVVVSPEDCARCHPVERAQYRENLMSHAFGNLHNNALYQDLVGSVNGVQTFSEGKLSPHAPTDNVGAESCYYCHGTEIKVVGRQTRVTSMGEMVFPTLSGWPNVGVGRVNPDGSLGSCASCHTRHRFSIEMARKPYTCAECHKGPDVPAYPVYEASKHGNIYLSLGKEWNFKDVPWQVGKDFSAPTCAACHVSLVVSGEGSVVAERSHRMNDRLGWRIFGLPYAHPHPVSPDTSTIRNKGGLPLPTELTGEPVSASLIDAGEQAKRSAVMQKICRACHAADWVNGQYARFEETVRGTNEMTLAATQVLLSAWDKGVAKGPGRKGSPFDEPIEKRWVEQWLFYANSTRFASAMAGADYGVFGNGRWYLSKNLREMLELLDLSARSGERPAPPLK
ncbi:MAG TPA: multiheme c-type cytochrome [Candidatus Deferrimicrobiaceae bacterium]|jgi:hypothetical protein